MRPSFVVNSKFLLLWILVLVGGCEWAASEKSSEEEVNGKQVSSESSMSTEDYPFDDWSTEVKKTPENGRWSHNDKHRDSFETISAPERDHTYGGKKKRAVYGILGLATKRPHKTASEVQHLPPLEAFMSVRGRKRSAFPFTASSTFRRQYPYNREYYYFGGLGRLPITA